MTIIVKIFHKLNLFKKDFIYPRKKLFFLLMLIMIIKTAFESLMAISLVPLFNSVIGNTTESNISNNFFGTIPVVNNILQIDNLFIISFLILITIMALKAVFSLIYYYIFYYTVSDYETQKRNLLFGKYIDLKWIFFIKQRSGETINTITREVIKSRQFVTGLLNIIDAFTTIIFYAIAAAFISLTSTLSTFCSIILLTFLFTPVLIKIKHYANKLVISNQNMMHHISELLSNLKIVKGCSMESVSKKIISTETEIMKNYMFKANFLKPIPLVIAEPLVLLIVISLIYLMQQFKLATITESAVIGFILLRSFQRASSMQSLLSSISDALPSYSLVNQLPVTLNKNKEQRPQQHISDFKKIQFKHVTFSYDNQSSALSNINLSIKKEEFIGIIGNSGAGKTTLIDLILSLLQPIKGEINIDSQNLNSIDPLQWRSLIGYVPQETILFNDTIYNNISLYKQGIGKSEVEWAASITDADQFILKTEHKFDTLVGDKGVKLSGGQRQRIAFARAIVSKPKILLLDEATSALDSISEKKIQQAIEKLRSDMTIIVIAHRLSTVKNADKLIVLENGKIIEKGSPKDLLKKKTSAFNYMYNIQSGKI